MNSLFGMFRINRTNPFFDDFDEILIFSDQHDLLLQRIPKTTASACLSTAGAGINNAAEEYLGGLMIIGSDLNVWQ